MKKNIIILEGISTAGKTTIMSGLEKYCKQIGITTLCIQEETTVIPLIDNTNLEVAINHINRKVKDILAANAQLIIIDRFHFSHLIKTAGTVKDFLLAETLLKKHNTLLVFLKINEKHISDRIFGAMNYREPEWGEFILKRSNGDKNDVVRFYKKRQKDLKVMAEQSVLNKISINTTNLNYKKIVGIITKHFIKFKALSAFNRK